jgi:ubiquinone biosynthesis protein COQ4
MLAQSVLAQPTLDTSLRPLDAIRAIRKLQRNPEDTAQIFVILRAMRGRGGVRMFRRFAESLTGKRVLSENRVLLSALTDQAGLEALPLGSLGRCYLAFMRQQNLDAAGLVQASEEQADTPVTPAVALFRDRMRDMHDLTHVVTGYGREPLGELCLLAFMHAHNRNPGVLMLLAMAWGRLPKRARRAVIQAWRNGRKARWLPETDWEGLLARPLFEVRGLLGIADPALYHAVGS